MAVSTHTRATVYDRRHADLFRATRGGLYARSGRCWKCIDYCGIRLA